MATWWVHYLKDVVAPKEVCSLHLEDDLMSLLSKTFVVPQVSCFLFTKGDLMSSLSRGCCCTTRELFFACRRRLHELIISRMSLHHNRVVLCILKATWWVHYLKNIIAPQESCSLHVEGDMMCSLSQGCCYTIRELFFAFTRRLDEFIISKMSLQHKIFVLCM